MILDIAVFGIFILCAVSGWRRGLLRTLSHTVGWIAALLCALMVFRPVCEFLSENTGLYDYMAERFAAAIKEETGGVFSQTDLLPDVLKESVNGAADGAVTASAGALAEIGIAVISFVAVFILTLILLLFLARYITKKSRRGIFGFANRLSGLVIGAVMGAVIAVLFANLLIPLTGIFRPDSLEDVVNAMDSSVIARALYEIEFNEIFLTYVEDQLG